MIELVAYLKIRAAIEYVKGLKRLDVIMRARLEAWLAILLNDFKSLIGVCPGYLDDDSFEFA